MKRIYICAPFAGDGEGNRMLDRGLALAFVNSVKNEESND
jgi:hypothetical protein